MRKVLIALAAAGSALAFATPSAAQYYPAPQPYVQGYGHGYGHSGIGHVRALQVRIDGIQRRIEHLRARRMLSRNEARSLREQSRHVERRLFRAAQFGLSPYEAQDVNRRIARLEYRVFREARDGNRWGRDYGQYGDRDRDGRPDRYEDDRGRDHDGRWDRDDD